MHAGVIIISHISLKKIFYSPLVLVAVVRFSLDFTVEVVEEAAIPSSSVTVVTSGGGKRKRRLDYFTFEEKVYRHTCVSIEINMSTKKKERVAYV